MAQVKEYGSWKSILDSKIACDSSISILRLLVDETAPDLLFWSELHPEKDGRTLVYSKSRLASKDDAATEWTPDSFNVATTLHEYGGAAYVVFQGSVYFMNGGKDPEVDKPDNRIFRQSSSTSAPVAITTKPTTPGNCNPLRYADADFSKNRNFFFCVREDHRDDDVNGEPTNTLVMINVSTGEETIVASGNNFYASPRVSPDGSKLCYFTWNHPNMPWDETEVWVASIQSLEDGLTVTDHKKAGGQAGVNFMEPSWTCDNKLMYISDPTLWWNLYVVDDLDTMVEKPVLQKNEEIGSPCWNLGNCSYDPHPSNKDLVVTLYKSKPSIVNIATGEETIIDLESHGFGECSIVTCKYKPVDGKVIYMHAVNPIKPAVILQYEVATKAISVLHESAAQPVAESYLSKPEAITFYVNDEKTEEAYGYYYAPKNPEFVAPDGSLPPLLIKIHGGPTGAASLGLDLNKQYFTSRGIAVFDIDYRGSTGHGTVFRNKLKGMWGVYDIEDTCRAALHMAENRKEVDINKLLTSGGSAGGYTTLADLTFRDVFATGASYYGISDLKALTNDTHKFESRYCDTMIGPAGDPVYEERSPYYHQDEFNSPCAFFQGLQDMVVPPNQSEEMFSAINQKGLPCSYVTFPDEAHGFDKSENKQKALNGEFYFYSKILGFEAADEGIEIEIFNLDGWNPSTNADERKEKRERKTK